MTPPHGEEPGTAGPPSARSVRIAMAIHALTASGVVLGLFGIVAVLDGDAKAALLWLVAAQVLDGVDGPLARAYNVRSFAPRVDGYVLDLVVDYVTTVVIPVAFLYQFRLLPPDVSLLLCGLVLFTAALWFARTDMVTTDHWFNGFPATWNLIIPPLFLLESPTWVNALVVVAFCALTLSNVKFVHPVQVSSDRPVTLAVTVAWLAAMTALIVLYPSSPGWLEALLVIGPLYHTWITVRRTRQHSLDEQTTRHD